MGRGNPGGSELFETMGLTAPPETGNGLSRRTGQPGRDRPDPRNEKYLEQ